MGKENLQQWIDGPHGINNRDIGRFTDFAILKSTNYPRYLFPEI